MDLFMYLTCLIRHMSGFRFNGVPHVDFEIFPRKGAVIEGRSFLTLELFGAGIYCTL